MFVIIGKVILLLASLYALIWVIPSTIPLWLKAIFYGGELIAVGRA